jgi:hypothetical protein
VSQVDTFELPNDVCNCPMMPFDDVINVRASFAGLYYRRVGVPTTVNTDARFILQYCCRRRYVRVDGWMMGER